MTKTASLLGVAFVAACLALPSTTARAQSAQTAEGAQAFLATMAKRGFSRVTFLDTLGRPNHVTGTHTVDISRIKLSIKEETSSNVVEKSLGEFVVSGLSSGDAQGAVDACTTRIDSFQPPAGVFENSSTTWEEPGFLVSVTVLKSEVWNYTEGFKKFVTPQFIDWRQAQVVRSNEGGRIDVRAKGQAFATNILSFLPGDPELADRIEYATKFLRMSCDETADTGF
ncbi:hypothetical protein [Pseudoxanthomonas sp. PXM02]|uniref:hypothetical protein n=1 Tax=Pseudoxanthomonas sp. PXM02 TaxID=2769294 RepID=UPI001780F110|nr:hypothetical protein [Pseudoxanthomonas sp. PXM02]MBD9481073.1 hypothetical protein [Pseudoxanthomonas sp. PXM02]